METSAKLLTQTLLKQILEWNPNSIASTISGSYRSTYSKMAVDTNWQNATKGFDPNQVAAYQNEQLIKVDTEDNVLGPISKGESHLLQTVKKGIYHRALSLLVFDSSNRFLLTQRASTKITFPDYYTNACCSHPLYNEAELEDDGNAVGVRRAVLRRSAFELGTKQDSFNYDELTLMNKLCYRAESDNGIWGEAEVDYIFILHKDIDLKLNAEEVKAFRYVTKKEMLNIISDAKENLKITPWVRLLVRDYLFKYWDNLHRLSEIAEPDKIVKYE